MGVIFLSRAPFFSLLHTCTTTTDKRVSVSYFGDVIMPKKTKKKIDRSLMCVRREIKESGLGTHPVKWEVAPRLLSLYLSFALVLFSLAASNHFRNHPVLSRFLKNTHPVKTKKKNWTEGGISLTCATHVCAYKGGNRKGGGKTSSPLRISDEQQTRAELVSPLARWLGQHTNPSPLMGQNTKEALG